jgi:phosphoglycolate phosphatase
MSETARKIDTVILDFDGTIANSGGVTLETFAEVLHRPPFTLEEISDLRALPTRTNMKNLGIRTWQIPYMLMRGRRLASEKMDRVEAFEGMPEAIRQLDAEAYGLHVVSSNSSGNINNLLERSGLDDSITSIRAGAGMFNKAKRLTNLLRRQDLTAEQCVHICDETRDIDAARQVGMRCLAVTWGYHAEELLAAHNPDALVATPAELVGAVHSLNPNTA